MPFNLCFRTSQKNASFCEKIKCTKFGDLHKLNLEHYLHHLQQVLAYMSHCQKLVDTCWNCDSHAYGPDALRIFKLFDLVTYQATDRICKEHIFQIVQGRNLGLAMKHFVEALAIRFEHCRYSWLGAFMIRIFGAGAQSCYIP